MRKMTLKKTAHVKYYFHLCPLVYMDLFKQCVELDIAVLFFIFFLYSFIFWEETYVKN